MFKRSKTSDFTASLTHAWGYYTVAKDTSAPLVFAVERTYPITYRDFPPRELIPRPSTSSPSDTAPREGLQAAAPAPLGRRMRGDLARPVAGFWRQAEPRFSHVLTWAIPPDVRPLIPARYRRVFAAGDLEIYARAE